MKYCVKENGGFLLKPIYCDNHLLILEKLPGVATQPDFHEIAREWVKRTFSKPGRVFLEPIHRLDKPASGMVLFARTSKALSRLNEAMRQKQFRKKYLAIVEGSVEKSGTLEHSLLHAEFRAVVNPNGKKAILHYKCIEKNNEYSLIEVEIETGRYHQIRAQFSAIGHPIIGDGKYGSKKKSKRILLHHQELSFQHPTTKEFLTFQCPAGFSFESTTCL